MVLLGVSVGFAGELLAGLVVLKLVLLAHHLLWVAHLARLLLPDAQSFILAHCLVLLYEFLEKGNLLVRIERISWDHVAGEDQDYFTVGHPLVVEWINLLEKHFDFFLRAKNVHHAEKLFELNLTDHSILVMVNRLEQVGEPDQESFVLLQLEV